MRILLWSDSADASALLDHLRSEGHDVRMYIDKPSYKISYKGILPIVDDYKDGLKKDDLIIFDMVKHGSIADKLRDEGYHVTSGGEYNDQIELDRSKGLFLMRRAGMDVGEVVEFPNLQGALEYAKKTKKIMVIKPKGNVYTEFTFVPSSKETLIEYLTYITENNIVDNNTEVVLQEKFDGVEISSEIWFSMGKPIWSMANHTFEEKKMMNDNLGQGIGCASSVCFRATDMWLMNKIFTSKLLRILEEKKYCGPLDANCIIVNKEPKGLEWTARFGYSAIYALMELFEGDMGDFLLFTAGGPPSSGRLGPGFSYSVRVSIPPYPIHYKDHKIQEELYASKKGLPLGVIPNHEHTWLLDITRNKKGEYEVAGCDCVIMEVTSKGSTIEAAKDKVSEHLKKLTLPDRQYRTDGYKRAIKSYSELFG